MQAEVARGKAAGLYVEQKIIKHGKLDQLTEGELDEKIAELMREMKIVDGELIDDSKKIVSSKDQSTKDYPKNVQKPISNTVGYLLFMFIISKWSAILVKRTVVDDTMNYLMKHCIYKLITFKFF